MLYPRGAHEAEATSEVHWRDRTRAEYYNHNHNHTMTWYTDHPPAVELSEI